MICRSQVYARLLLWILIASSLPYKTSKIISKMLIITLCFTSMLKSTMMVNIELNVYSKDQDGDK